jgi:hypothetical protein
VIGAPDGAANGYTNLTMDPGVTPYRVGYPFAVNGSDGSVYMAAVPLGEQPNVRILRASRGAAPAWSKAAGQGTTAYDTNAANGLLGAQVNTGLGAYSSVLAWQSGQLFSYLAKDVTSGGTDPANAFFKIFDTTNAFAMTHVAGFDATPVDTVNQPFCVAADGGMPPAAGCELYVSPTLNTRPSFDAANNRWLVAKAGDRRILSLVTGGAAHTEYAPAHPIASFVYVPDLPGVFYCEKAAAGRLFMIDGGGEAQISLPTGMACDGGAMLYDPARRGVVFSFLQNALAGVAEYVLP